MTSMPRSDRTLVLRGVQPPPYQAMLALAKSQAEKARAQGMLGYALSDLGQHEQALAAAQEAVQLYRQLAQAQPGAFLPDLARSLGAHGTVLLGLGRAAEAAQAFREALQALLPFLRACAQAGQPPDVALGRAVKWDNC